MAGATGDQRNAGPAGEPRIGIGHVDAGRFMARMDQLDAGVEQGIEQRHDVIAGQRKDVFDASALQGLGQRVGAAKLFHVSSRMLRVDGCERDAACADYAWINHRLRYAAPAAAGAVLASKLAPGLTRVNFTASRVNPSLPWWSRATV